jgi:hypothetical protein
MSEREVLDQIANGPYAQPRERLGSKRTHPPDKLNGVIKRNVTGQLHSSTLAALGSNHPVRAPQARCV